MEASERRELIVSRLREAMQRAGGQNALGRILSRGKSTVSGWATGRTQPDLVTFARICDLAKRPADYLLGLTDSPEPQPPAIDESAFLTVPLLADTVAAGQPRLVGAKVIVRLPFTKHWLKSRLGVLPREGRLVLVRVDEGLCGWSMIPTILPGSMLLVDRGPGGEGLSTVEPGRVYLLQLDGGLTVKRCYLVDRHLVASPDNRTKDHQPEVVELRDRDLREVIKGRVIWVANQDL